MDIEWLRDLAIIIVALTAAIALILAVLFAYSLYRESKIMLNNMNSILDSARNISKSAEGIFSQAETISRSFNGIVTAVRIINKITGLFRKKEE